jgi:hypothetical protein
VLKARSSPREGEGPSSDTNSHLHMVSTALFISKPNRTKSQ